MRHDKVIGWIDVNLPKIVGTAGVLCILGILLTWRRVGLPLTWTLGPAGFVLFGVGIAARAYRRRVAVIGALIGITSLICAVQDFVPRDRFPPPFSLLPVALWFALIIANRRVLA